MNKTRSILRQAISIAIVFTFSCSLGDGGEGGGDGNDDVFFKYYDPNDKVMRCRNGVVEYKCDDKWYNFAKYRCTLDGAITWEQYLEEQGYLRCSK